MQICDFKCKLYNWEDYIPIYKESAFAYLEKVW